MKHFGRFKLQVFKQNSLPLTMLNFHPYVVMFVDHLVTNAGVSPVSMFERVPDITKFAPTMVRPDLEGYIFGSHAL